jgi:hypothetical protein
MVFLTIPVPRSSHTAREYMCCLDELSGRLVAEKVPVIFVRGNNQNVLTPWYVDVLFIFLHFCNFSSYCLCFVFRL